MCLLKRCRVVSFCVMVLAGWGGYLWAHRATDGFTLGQILFVPDSLPEWPTQGTVLRDCPADLNLLRILLGQRLYYFGKGAQCFVFVTEDGQYIVKFLRQRITRCNLGTYLCMWLPAVRVWAAGKIGEKRNRATSFFASCAVAHDMLCQETGLLASQFLICPQVDCGELLDAFVVVDRLKIVHRVPLGASCFTVQRRGVPVLQQITRFMEEGKEEEACHLISSLFRLIDRRLCLRVLDSDSNFRTNFVALGQEAIQIDIGTFSPPIPEDDPTFIEKLSRDFVILKEKNQSFSQWLHEEYPALGARFREEFAHLCTQYGVVLHDVEI